MKKRFSISALLSITAFVALLLCFVPRHKIYLHRDLIPEIAKWSKGNIKDWQRSLGRTEHALAAWRNVDSANTLWEAKYHSSAIEGWWETAAAFRDTDAAYAALSNASSAYEYLGDKRNAAQALEMLLLIPEPQFRDRGMISRNYRHNACAWLAEYHEQLGNLPFAERFLSQSLYQDRLSGACGTHSLTVRSEQKNRLQKLRQLQSK